MHPYAIFLVLPANKTVAFLQFNLAGALSQRYAQKSQRRCRLFFADGTEELHPQYNSCNVGICWLVMVGPMIFRSRI